MSIELSATKFPYFFSRIVELSEYWIKCDKVPPKKTGEVVIFFHFGDCAKIFDSAGGDQSAAGENFDVLGSIYVFFRAKIFDFNEQKPKILP